MQNQKRGGHSRQPGGVPTPRRLGGAPKRVVPRPRRRADGRRERPRARRGFRWRFVDGRSVSVLEAGIQQTRRRGRGGSFAVRDGSFVVRRDETRRAVFLDEARQERGAGFGGSCRSHRARGGDGDRPRERALDPTHGGVGGAFRGNVSVRRSCFFFLSFASRLSAAPRRARRGRRRRARAGRVHATARARTRDHPLAIRRRPLHRRAQARLRQRGPARDAHQTLAQRRGDERRVERARRASVAFGFFFSEIRETRYS